MNIHYKQRRLDSEPDVDTEKVKQLEKKMQEMTKKLSVFFKNELKENPQDAQLIFHSIVYGPITFMFDVCDKMNDWGIEPNEMFPTLFRVYKNYAEILGKFDVPYNSMTYEEFRARFADFYTQTHYAWAMDENTKKG